MLLQKGLIGNILLMLLTVTCPGNIYAESDPFYIIATGDLRGEIQPCGCSEDGDLGGLLRRDSYLAQSRSQTPGLIYLDLGNNFPPPSEQGSLKVDLIQKSFKSLKPQVILVGPNEWLYGLKTMDTSLPYLLSNTSKSEFFHEFFILNKGKAGVWGFVSPSLLYQNKNDENTIYPASRDLVEQWNKNIAELKKKILLFRGNSDELAIFEKTGWFDLIITGNNFDDELNQVLEMKTASNSYPSVPTKGQGVVVLSLKGTHWTNQVEWLNNKIPDSANLIKPFEEYNEQVKELFFKNLENIDTHKLETPYTGNEVCKACHLVEFQIWSQSRHAQAFDTLKKLNKHYDPECVQCHVVGLNKKGFASIELTPELANVQCENCHGPGKLHAQMPQNNLTAKPAATVCTSCHHGGHSPHFSFEIYWPKIQHQKQPAIK
ncbi:MAG: hypothetical protein HQM12_14935 [SAR324 cluster bacterium]|nr:hypothetical protein [SAR324 cluster bacterium]